MVQICSNHVTAMLWNPLPWKKIEILLEIKDKSEGGECLPKREGIKHLTVRKPNLSEVPRGGHLRV
jgi:hypothetical protein